MKRAAGLLGALVLVSAAKAGGDAWADWAKGQGLAEEAKPSPWWIERGEPTVTRSFAGKGATITFIGGRFATPEARKAAVENRWRTTAAARVKTPFPSLEKKGITVYYMGAPTNLVAVLENGRGAIEVLAGHEGPANITTDPAFGKRFESAVDLAVRLLGKGK